ncbi:MAG: hypothetical protein AAGE52_02935 [Myxococcota bacterium]
MRWLTAGLLVVAACGDDGVEPMVDAGPRTIPLNTEVTRAHTFGECVERAGRSLLAVSAEGDLWFREGANLVSVTLDGTEQVFPEEAMLDDAVALGPASIAFASGGLFNREGEFVDSIPWPEELGAPTIVCGDPNVDRDGFVVAGDLFQRAGGQWWRWFPAEGEFGEILEVPEALGACRAERGETWLHTTTGLWRVRDQGLDRVEELPELVSAEFGFGFEAAALTAEGLFFGPDEWRTLEFEAGAVTLIESTGSWLYVKAGDRYYRFTGANGEFVETVDFGLDASALYGYADGLWLETPDELCNRRIAEAPLVVRGVRPFERTPPMSLSITVEGPMGALVMERDDVVVHEEADFAGVEEITGIFAGDPGWHTLEVSVGETAREIRYEVVTNSGATYVDSIAPIFEVHCAGSECHGSDRDDEDRPDLSTYDGWVNASRAIRNRVGRVRDMPPFEDRLESWDAEEIALVIAWIDEGMVRGE